MLIGENIQRDGTRPELLWIAGLTAAYEDTDSRVPPLAAAIPGVEHRRNARFEKVTRQRIQLQRFGIGQAEIAGVEEVQTFDEAAPFADTFPVRIVRRIPFRGGPAIGRDDGNAGRPVSQQIPKCLLVR